MIRISGFERVGVVSTVVLVCVIAAAAFPDRGDKDSRYVVQELGGLPETNVTVGEGLNNFGEVVGYCYPHVPPGHLNSLLGKAFYWSGGTMRPLPGLSGGTSHAFAINDNGTAVGDADDGENWVPVRWKVRPMSRPVVLAQQTGVAFAVNRRGDIAGAADGVVRWRRGAAERVPLPDKISARVTGITDTGTVVGYTGRRNTWFEDGQKPFRWDGGSLHAPSGESEGDSAAMGVNAGGQEVGWRQDARHKRVPCVWNGGRQQVLPLPQGFSGEAHSVNRGSVVVGTFEDGERRTRAGLWEHGRFHALDTEVDPPYTSPLLDALAINDRGEITAELFTTVSTERCSCVPNPIGRLRIRAGRTTGSR